MKVEIDAALLASEWFPLADLDHDIVRHSKYSYK